MNKKRKTLKAIFYKLNKNARWRDYELYFANVYLIRIASEYQSFVLKGQNKYVPLLIW